MDIEHSDEAYQCHTRERCDHRKPRRCLKDEGHKGDHLFVHCPSCKEKEQSSEDS